MVLYSLTNYAYYLAPSMGYSVYRWVWGGLGRFSSPPKAIEHDTTMPGGFETWVYSGTVRSLYNRWWWIGDSAMTMATDSLPDL